jgi:ribonuclease HI
MSAFRTSDGTLRGWGAIAIKGHALIVEVCGVSRGNPGLSGAGVVIRDLGGHIVEQRSRYLGVSSPPQADYHAVIEGLTAVSNHNPTHISLHIDNEAMWRQLLGRSSARSPEVIELYSQVLNLLQAIRDVAIELRDAEELDLAYRLANVAVDTRGRRQAVD